SVHTAADRARDGEPQSSSLSAGPRQTKGGEQGAGNARAVVIHFSEVGGAQGLACRCCNRRHWRTCGRATSSRINCGRSGRPFRRLLLACGGREPGGALIRRGRPWSSFVPGTRAFSRRCDCLVESYV